MENTSYLIFIYDNLRFGNKENTYLIGSTYLGVAKTVDKYAMVGIKITNNVFITEDELEEQYTKTNITGEIYRVDFHTLAFLDVFILKDDFYVRKKINVSMKDQQYEVFVYLHEDEIFNEFPTRLGGKRFFPVPSGDWSETKFLSIV